MQNLNIRADAISNVDVANRNQIDINILGADLSFLSDIHIIDVLRELDMSQVLEYIDDSDIISYLESNGYAVTN